MLPLLLISKSPDATTRFVNDFAQKNSYSALHIQHIFPEKTTISIDQSREIRDDALRGTARKLLVIHQFDTAQTEAQNALLKTLEESNEYIQFILEITDENSVLPTIRSRAHLVRTDVESTDNEELLQIIQEYDFSASFNLSEGLKKSYRIKKDDAEKVLSALLSRLHAQFLAGNYSSELVTATSYVLEQLNAVLRSNVNPEYTLDAVFLKIAPLKIL